MVAPIRPLVGHRVVDLTRFVSGSYTTMLLAGLGAEVLKLELPPKGDPYRGQGGVAQVGDESALFLALNSAKSSVAIDFRSPDCEDVVEALLASSSFVVENARPGSLRRYRLDHESVLERHPAIVYGSISGYGQVGPDADRGGFDLTLQADSGIMSVTGDPVSGPVKVGAPLLDIGAGVSCALGLLAAHAERERTGRGAHVSSSLLEFALAGLGTLAADLWASGTSPGLLGTHSPSFAPYGAFRARDGYVVIAGAGAEHLWQRLCDTVGVPELVHDPRFATNAARVAHRDELTELLERALASRPVNEWTAELEATGVPVGTIRSLDEVLASDQVQALRSVRELHHESVGPYRIVAGPLRVGDEPVAPDRSAPRLGEHTRPILESLGVDPDRVASLEAENLVVTG